MSANILSIFAAKAPVEPTAPNQDQVSDDGSDFKSFMDNAAHKTDRTHKPSKENSTQNQNNSQTKKTQSNTSKANSSSEDNSNYHEVSGPNDDNLQSAPESVNKDSLTEDTEVLSAQLQELDIDQDRFEALLDLLGLNGEADMDVLLQSLSQALNLSSNNTGEKINSAQFLGSLQQNKGETVNFLKQAGLSGEEAKNLLNHLQSLQNISTQQILDTNVNDEVPSFLAQLTKTKNVTEKTDPLAKVPEKTDPLIKVPEKNDSIVNRTNKINGSASADKLQESPTNNQAPRITIQEPVIEKPGTASNLGELLTDKNAQANILQTENFTDGKNYNKGLETVKIISDLQVQPPTATANTAVKAVESSKPILPENLLARGATEVKIINQIADKMTVRSNGSDNEVHIKLDPPSLGKVRMNIITSGDSVRTLIVAENQAVKQVIENNFNQLRDAMNEQGLKIDSFTVTVGGESNQQKSQDESSGKEDNPSSLEQTAADDTNEKPVTETVPVFFGDNQSISVIV